jgi:predicted amino acid dehydrogenase
MLPHLGRETPWFAFIVHLRDTADAERFGFGVFLRRYSADDDDYRRKLCSLPPVVAAQISFRNTAITGELICIMRLPEQLGGPDGKHAIREGVDLAVSRGAAVIGLGGLTAPVMGGGLLLADRVPRNVTLTNGNALTAAVVRTNVLEAARRIGLGTRARVAVIGCTGSVGGAATRLIAMEGFPLTLIGRNAQRVARCFPDVAGESTGDLDRARSADIVVVLTNDATATLEAAQLKPGAVVIDCAQPPNIARPRQEELACKGASIAEGGLVFIDSYAITGDLAPGVHGATFACLAETFLFARAGIRVHSIGRPEVEQSLRMERLARRNGVAAAALTFAAAPLLEAYP